MDSSNGGRGLGEQNYDSEKGKKLYHRHSTQQIQHLEAFYKECRHPDKSQRQQLSRDLGLDPKQIKFWFQNKRTQIKAYNKKADNNSLRSENERIRFENLAMQEALKTISCPSCNGSCIGEDGDHNILLQLSMENVRLKEEHERAILLFANRMGNPSLPSPVMKPIANFPANHFRIEGMGPTTLDLVQVQVPQIQALQLQAPQMQAPQIQVPQMQVPQIQVPLIEAPQIEAPQFPENPVAQYWLSGIMEMDRSSIFEAAAAAITELMDLVNLNEPVWAQAPEDGRYILHRDSYDKLYPHSNHIKSASARFESSRDSGEVPMDAINLIDILLDANKWKDMFPNIVNEAKTIEVMGPEALGGAVNLMYEKLHVLSPLVAPREFFFIRFCRQFNSSTWVMVDVSSDFIQEFHDAAPNRAWKLPSGCVIEDLSNGKSAVTWIEHVQVDDKSLTHRLYRDLVSTCQAYGAKRWLTTLQRMCERYAFSMGFITAPRRDLEGVIETPEGQKNLMRLSHKMVKDFCEALSKSDKLDFPHMPEFENNGVRVSFRSNNDQGQLAGFVITAATSIWLPLLKESIFEYLYDERNRHKWDVLAGGNPVNTIANIPSGTHPANSVSILQPFIPTETKMLMLQESSMDPLGAVIIYAPMDLSAVISAIKGEDPMTIPILPSGFIISSDGREKKATGASSSSNTNHITGSLLTLEFQILACRGPLTQELSMESVANVHTLISSTIQKIKAGLNVSD